MSFETARQQWREGERFAADPPADDRDAIVRVEAQVLAELRRRLGGAFMIDELVAMYDEGTGWCLDLAARVSPNSPAAWDARIADAAFGRYVREAQDYAGGRRIDGRP